ncbi:ABC transporter permease [Actinomadura sp. CNU-125]|uniref:ABC transporter permease n=1 Tax=Actinomadura sp. CNU-125 TaxID=1904961 RepID=UPI002916E14F|nr:ABC transporter permease [Actinomadura sp. CNU-125]
MTTTTTPGRLAPADLARTASVGLRTRRLRAGLSALGIAIGVASIVAVLGLSASSQAGLLAEIDRLGTNMLTVSPGVDIEGNEVKLPMTSPEMVARIGPVQRVQTTGKTDAKVYRSPLVPEINSNGLTVQATSLDLPETVRTRVAEGVFLNEPPRRSRPRCSATTPPGGSASTGSAPGSGSGSASSGSTSPGSSPRPTSPRRSTRPS